MNRTLLVILIVVGVVFVGGFAVLVYIGTKGPETYIYAENEIPSSYKQEMKDLGLIKEDERIIYFYSDGLVDVKDGMYALTDHHLILYSTQWSEPETVIGFEEISYLDVDYDDSFLTDSYVLVETEDGMTVEFPLSSERGRDKEFYNLLSKKVEEAH